MDGSIFTTATALLLLCALAPASQAPRADALSSAGSSAASAPVSATARTAPEAAMAMPAIDARSLPASSLALALEPLAANAAAETAVTETAAAEAAAGSGEPTAAAVTTDPQNATQLAASGPDAQPVSAQAQTRPAAEPTASDQTLTVAAKSGSTAAGEAGGSQVDAETAETESSTASSALAEESLVAAEALLDETIEPLEPSLKELADTPVEEVEAAMAAADADAPASLPADAIDAELASATEADAAEAAAVLASATVEEAPMQEPFDLLGESVQAGTMQRLTWNATEAFSGTTVPTPVLVSHGTQKGPTVCLTAAVHGDELNGIETVRRIIHDVPPEKLSGTLIGVPIVNMAGFQRHSRYLPDRRDLNRFFPGHPRGSSASRIAYSFFREIIVRCDGLIDLHTGSFHRTNLPQLRANLNNEAVVKLTEGFGSTIILHSEGGVGTLRRAAVDAGVPAVTLEAGEPLRLQDDEVRHSVRGIYTLLETLGMYDKRGIRGGPEPVYYTSEWIRADTGGILFSKIKLGKRIKRDDLLGTVTDPISNEREEIRSPFSGRVIGMALNQFVMPGFATYHIGIEADDADEAKQTEDPDGLSHDVAFEPDMDRVE